MKYESKPGAKRRAPSTPGAVEDLLAAEKRLKQMGHKWFGGGDEYSYIVNQRGGDEEEFQARKAEALQILDAVVGDEESTTSLRSQCANCGSAKVRLTCGGCKGPVYCSSACGRRHWDGEHSLRCGGAGGDGHGRF